MMFAIWTVIAAAQVAGGDLGSATAVPPTDRVEIVLFSDFQCPFCAQLAPVVREIQANGIDGVPVVVEFKNYPLTIHRNAQLAHQAAMAAKEQGKFWEMHDLLFANSSKVQRSDLMDYATRLGLDMVLFQKDLDSDRIKQRIADDVSEGNRVGVSGTPTYNINARSYSGMRSLDELKEVIAADRRRTRAMTEIPDNLMSKGLTDAPVTLELFADLESPVSQQALEVIEQVMQSHPSTVRLQFRNFPLAFHPQAMMAHEAAMSAARQGRFWELAAFILDHQDSLREQDLITYGRGLGLDEDQFARTIEEHEYAPRVEADVIAGQSRGLRGSPVILIDDKRIDGVPSLKTLTDYVDAALGSRSTQANLPRGR